MRLIDPLLPSRRSLLSCTSLTVVAGLIVFAGLSPDVHCGAGSWSCATLSGVAVVAALFGIGFGLAITALLVLLLSGLNRIWSSLPTLEVRSRVWSVAFGLLLAHLGVFAVLNVLGLLPPDWPWWLGSLGVLGVVPGGTQVYLIQ